MEKYYKLFIQSLIEWDFGFFRKIDLFLADFWSNFLFLLGPICRFRTKCVIFFREISNFLALSKLLPFLPHWPRNCRNPSMWSLPLECHFVPGTIFCPRFRGRSLRLHGTGLPRRWPANFINPRTHKRTNTRNLPRRRRNGSSCGTITKNPEFPRKNFSASSFPLKKLSRNFLPFLFSSSKLHPKIIFTKIVGHTGAGWLAGGPRRGHSPEDDP